MLIAGLFVAMVGGKTYLHAQQVKAEQGQIVELIRSFGENLGKANYDAAWNQLSPKITDATKKEDFVEFWTRFQLAAGNVKEMKWNGYLDVQTDTETGYEMAHGVIIADYAMGGLDRRQATFRKTDSGWKIEDIGINFTEAIRNAPAP
jgi:hypothetical protein